MSNALLLLLIALTGVANAQSVRVSHFLRPEGPIRNDPVQLVVTVDAPRDVTGGTLTILTPSGFTVTELRASGSGPASTQSAAGSTIRVELGSFQGQMAKAFMIEASGGSLQRGKYRIVTTVLANDAAPRPGDTSRAAPAAGAPQHYRDSGAGRL